MKNILKTGLVALSLVFASACSNDDYDIGEIAAPTNLQVETNVVGQSEDMPDGDGSGEVTFNATADGAMTYKYVFGNGSSVTTSNGVYTHQFSETGTKVYTVNIIAYGPGGTASSMLVDVEVLVTYAPPADLLEKLVGKEWRIKAEVPGHFGLGPVGGLGGPEFFAVSANEKAEVGMYDDRYIFNEDGTFTHITNANNDESGMDPSGTVFGRINLVDQLGVSCACEVQGADVLNIPYNDYTENWSISAPGGNETINLTGLGFIGYYIGGNHRYEIFDRSGTNELTLRSTDGNGEFDWWFILTSDSVEEEEEFESQFNTEIWSDDFDGDALNTDNWNYEIGNGDNGWGNGEAQYYTDAEDNVKVENGNLVITAKREAESGFDFTSARITTKDKFEFTFGRVEVRAKLPAGGGTWPAIWMLGAGFPEESWPGVGEIDIMEFVGNNPDRISSALHLPGNSGGNAVVGDTEISEATTEFHIYEVEWTAEKITFLMDGEPHLEFDNDDSTPFQDDFYLLLNIAMGGTLGGDIADDFQESTMEVDYVKVYQE
ncbi:Glycosyl hydrolases family 16 [Salegentibacter holothuriorum]|uniref:Glycosyl hydrolases family 16 n=1 Tax=Salegentibacter holothuriorum TaxID=241145 RepID=A0A1T5BX96_9FLAO|nr:glycoside hydrolase family 16 protein [Salegentibacter holothuriorum]SKB51982.1 Glycosyl hydrolases family 16 [Salegentibacter holothuriorum]